MDLQGLLQIREAESCCNAGYLLHEKVGEGYFFIAFQFVLPILRI